ncbi:MAG: hypothetical protein VKN13_00795 [Cyanobacteriota bacterium]|nr:hypothetical protein [Cyanobacteriota bacterium]
MTGVQALAPHAANAACIPGTTYVQGTNCRYFTSSTDSEAFNVFTSVNINDQRYFQMAFETTGGQADISGIRYSTKDPLAGGFDPLADWTAFTTPTVTGANTSGLQYTGIQDFGSFIGQDSIWIGFTIESEGNTVPIGESLFSVYTGNRSGANSNGVLSGGIAFSQEFRNQESVPGPLPLLGAAAAFSTSRRLRRRLKAGSCG